MGIALALVLVGAGDAGDQRFVDQALTAGLAEVKMASLAVERAQSLEVKQFARKLLAEHTRTNMELQQVAQSCGLRAPTQPTARQQQAYDGLARLEGAAFDREYLRLVAADHDAALELYRSEGKNGKDDQLKELVMRTLPTVEKHDALAHTDEDSVMKLGN
jgi:putative membrane protein